MPKAKAKKGDQNTTLNVIDDINEIIGDMNQTASQDEEELVKLEKIAAEIDEALQIEVHPANFATMDKLRNGADALTVTDISMRSSSYTFASKT